MSVGRDALLYLDEARVAELCGTVDPLRVVADAFQAVREGRAAVTPEAALRWTAPDGTAARSLILPARHVDSYGCKIINACLGNVDRGLPRADGLIVLFDPDTAAPVCLMDAGHISALRTAAVSVAAVGAVLDLSDIRRVAFLGCGRQSRTHLDLLGSRCPLSAVTVYDTEPQRAVLFAKQAKLSLPEVTIDIADTAEAAVRSAPLTIAATTTTTAYVRPEWLPDGATFVNVSLDDATEDLLLGCDHLFVDDWTLVSDDDTRLLGRLARAGRVAGPDQVPPPGARNIDAEFATLLAGAYQRPIAKTDRVVINPFGMGVHDIALAAHVYAAARSGDTGVRLPR
ncbi:Ornithine cyclodeaminase [Alloactinosynnema sp. L-07]|uniref:ornithine cyclodeaminase n=1 Tax=Alloactinosynnema sp. L-07 TaxID=1653480 RepID=UPI00065F03A1|nr:ornithine cyclodeaminase [Alloactinosynnema sp. L-07]CRK56752.1 Ornithine cyclodeaminase [Alloactinosynnema sp. L-07]